MALTTCQTKRISKGLVFFWVSTFLLFFDFYSNSGRVAEENFFQNFQRFSQSLVLGRVVKSRQDGIFSAAGFPGHGFVSSKPGKWYEADFEFQYEAYFEGRTFNSYVPYQSQIGGQGILFSFLDKIIPVSSQSKLKLFYMINAFLLAFFLMMVVYWFYLEFDLFAAGAALASMVFSLWLVLFGRTLYWSVWAFYLPMVIAMFYLRQERTPAKQHAIKFIGLVFIGVFIKTLFNGYEYMTTTLVMMLVPLVFYSVARGMGTRWFLRYAFLAGLSAGMAILLSMGILCFQIAYLKGGWMDGINHILYALERRTYGTPDSFSPELTMAQMLWIYIKDFYINLETYFTINNPLISKIFLRIRYIYLIFIFLIATGVLFIKKHRPDFNSEGGRVKALMVSTWFSILAPLSWFLVFKEHAVHHTHMDSIVWQMPFTIFGFALCGLAVKRVWRFLFPQA